MSSQCRPKVKANWTVGTRDAHCLLYTILLIQWAFGLSTTAQHRPSQVQLYTHSSDSVTNYLLFFAAICKRLGKQPHHHQHSISKCVYIPSSSSALYYILFLILHWIEDQSQLVISFRFDNHYMSQNCTSVII